MRFAIRDDDTNFFTTPEELEACYGNIWDQFPVTLCLISQVKGNWKHWVHQIYKDKHETDWVAWNSDNTPYPIKNNEALVSYLKNKIQEGKVDLAFHAKYHRNGDEQLPTERNNNYVRGAEFFTNRDLTNYIKDELASLNETFNYPISVFTPPQNLLSEKGYKAVINAGLNICGGGITFYKKQKDIPGLINIGKQFGFKLMHRDDDYPYVLNYGDHSEIVYHYPLQPGTPLKQLIDAFEKVRRHDGDFVLSTHYVEFPYPMVYDPTITMKQVLEQFLEHVSKYNVQKLTLSQLLKN
ncbi:MAG: DUF2334 domain-containing protein [Flavipsychrobacter sp.]